MMAQPEWYNLLRFGETWELETRDRTLPSASSGHVTNPAFSKQRSRDHPIGAQIKEVLIALLNLSISCWSLKKNKA